ncbi:uncharacterized protein BX663DRAFT_102185 [Cokeromyces recurvatus]|uniref:uncharacterized protein n=1 Tax=Cokeromyces recurvatus TaxID=90255 RepID=UPI00221E6288|nr:uncharacterized protein BX663DRAFT_102185 [Cokeromyces recurvatus]KAI7901709.1 hypothetical protein BX663DRAFT_102185 [Cokeromyces recurvatus]
MNSNNNVSWMSMSAPQANDERILSSSRLKRIIPTKTGNSVNQSIIDKSSSSSTMMHYDDVKGKKAIEEAILPKNKIEEHTILSPSISSTTTTTSHSVDFSLSPFHQLHHQIVNMLKRINQTETRTLNRQLRRAFDIFELSNMSNSIIENIITDIDHLKMQFLWIEDVKQELWIHDVSMADFFPLMGVVQEMLKEISQLKMTLNDLQVDYVKKIEKNDIRLKEEALGKQQLQIQQRTMKESTSYHGPLSWLLSNIFQKRPENIPDQSSNLVPSYRPFHTRFSTSEICTTASAYSRSKPKRVPSVPTVVDKDESVVQCQKSIDRYGPSSSFPTTRSTAKVDNHFAKRRSTHTTHGTTADQSSSFPLLRASQSVGTVRRSQASPALEYIVRKKKRSSLGLNSLFTTDLLGLPHHQSSPDEIANRFPTSWLGNK